MDALLLKDILLLFLVSLPVVLLLKRVHFPIIIGFLLTGALIGNHGLAIISDTSRIHALAELGLALLLFSVGVEFSLDSFQKIRTKAIAAALLQITLTFGCGVLIGKGLDWPMTRCLYFGCVLSLSSSAVVMTMLNSRRMIDSVPGQFTTTTLIIQDLAFIPMIVLLPLVSLSQVSSSDSTDLLMNKGLALGGLLLTFIIGRLIIARMLRLISAWGKREVFVIAVMLIGLGGSWVTAEIGLSFALGSFVAGLLIGFTDYKYQALSEISPFRYCFNSLFFVSIGMMINFAFIIENWAIVLMLIIAIPIIKFLIVFLVMSLMRIPFRISLITGMALAQIGEFSFLLVQSGFKDSIIDSYLFDLIITSSVITMMLTPFLIINAPKMASKINKVLRKFIPKSNPHKWESSDSKIKDHVIICGFGPLGQTLASQLKKRNIPYLVLELNARTIKKIQSQNDIALYGDGASYEILHKSNIQQARLLAITVPTFLDNIAIIKQAKQIQPDIPIVTRAKYKSDCDKLYAAGAQVVISEELEGGIEMSRYALKRVGVPSSEADELVEQIREYGSADFFS